MYLSLFTSENSHLCCRGAHGAMAYLKFAVFIISLHHVLSGHSHYSHTIPIEGYETKLHDLGQHVEIPETPLKVIKITKTVAVKIPVPYPVKVKEKVPYPVHVAKPYPVPVPQIIKVPHVITVAQKNNQEGGWNGDVGEHGNFGAGASFYGQQGSHLSDGHDVNRAYEVQDNSQTYPSASDGHSLSGIDSTAGHDEASAGFSYEPQSNAYGHPYGGDNVGKLGFDTESQTYDDAINEYFKQHSSHGSGGADV